MLKAFERVGATASVLLQKTRDDYLNEARSYDADRLRDSVASTLTAWRVTGAALLLAGLAILSLPITLWVLLPLKTTEHVPVVINKDTGEVRLPQVKTGTSQEFATALIESAAYAYVFNREGYLRQTLPQQYGFVKAFSKGVTLDTLNEAWNIKNPESPRQKFGNTRVDIAKRSVRFQPGNVVVVEFVKTIDAGGQNETKQTLAATLVYELTYSPPTGEDDRQHNPFGLFFPSYRLSGVTEIPQ
jgi:type IV secretion system protein VirB8